MTTAEELLAGKGDSPGPPIKRDRYGRYLLNDPITGEEKPYTRATTIAKTMSDQYQIGKWRERMVALGISRRPDLIAGAAALSTEQADKKALQAIAESAAEAAGASSKATLGTALHRFTERLDKGEPTHAPEAYHADLLAYAEELQRIGVIVHPELMERVLVLPDIGVAGTTDRILELNGELLIGDLKTGATLDFGGMDIAIQLALYAHATHYLNDDGEWEEMPKVNQERGMVLHLPVQEGRCEAKSVDIATGWEMVQAALEVRQWRKRKNFLIPWSSFEPAPNASELEQEEPQLKSEPSNLNSEEEDVSHDDYLVGRIKLCGENENARRYLTYNWPQGVPTRPPWTSEQEAQVEKVLTDAEADGRMPFPTEEPSSSSSTWHEESDVETGPPAPDWKVDDGGIPPTDEMVEAVGKMIASLEKPRREAGVQWAMDSKLSHDFSGLESARQFAIALAAVACLDHLWTPEDGDYRVRVALELATGPPIATSWRTGAILGALSAVQAGKLRHLAEKFGEGHTATVEAFARVASTE